MRTYYVETKQGKVFETQNLEYWSSDGHTLLAAKEGRERLKAEAINELKELLKVPCTIYTVLRHCSASGMQREIILHVAAGGQILNISYYASKAIGASFGKRNGLVIKGCGMDMGFDLVYNLSARLYGDGYKIRQEWI